jgi:hypothetical protein
MVYQMVLAASGFLDVAEYQERDQPGYDFTFVPHSHGNSLLLLLFSDGTKAGR